MKSETIVSLGTWLSVLFSDVVGFESTLFVVASSWSENKFNSIGIFCLLLFMINLSSCFAKIVQGSAEHQACLNVMLSRSLSYAKIVIVNEKHAESVLFVSVLPPHPHGQHLLGDHATVPMWFRERDATVVRNHLQAHRATFEKHSHLV